MDAPSGPPFYVTLQTVERLKVESEQHTKEIAQIWDAIEPLHSAVDRYEVFIQDLRCQRQRARDLWWKWVVGVCIGLSFVVGGIMVKMYLLEMPPKPATVLPSKGSR